MNYLSIFTDAMEKMQYCLTGVKNNYAFALADCPYSPRQSYQEDSKLANYLFAKRDKNNPRIMRQTQEKRRLDKEKKSKEKKLQAEKEEEISKRKFNWRLSTLKEEAEMVWGHLGIPYKIG